MSIKRVVSWISFVAGCVLLLLPSLALADAIVAQSYKANEKFAVGTLVSRSSDSDSVSAAEVGNRAGIIGAVVNKQDSFVTYNIAQGTVQVATSGIVPINVSTVNGNIKSGDQLTSSPIAGFAMKATSPGKTIGRAVQDFSSSSNGAQIRDVSDSKGKQVKVAIGQAQVAIQLSDWAGTSGASNPFVDNLQSVASQVIGRQVNAASAMIAAFVLSIAILVSGIVLFSSVTSSIHSLGRNPLSHSVIRRSLTQVILLVVALMTASVLVAYLIIGR